MTDIAWIHAALTSARPEVLGALLRYFRNLDTAEEAVFHPLQDEAVGRDQPQLAECFLARSEWSNPGIKLLSGKLFF